jgi:hypothetical protein
MGRTEQPDLAHRLRTPLAVIVGYIYTPPPLAVAGDTADTLAPRRAAAADLGAQIDAVVAAESASHGGRGDEAAG